MIKGFHVSQQVCRIFFCHVKVLPGCQSQIKTKTPCLYAVPQMEGTSAIRLCYPRPPTIAPTLLSTFAIGRMGCYCLVGERLSTATYRLSRLEFSSSDKKALSAYLLVPRKKQFIVPRQKHYFYYLNLKRSVCMALIQ